MRIVGGLYKGRIFSPGKSFKARPTTDFAKENLFNILENRINWEETTALDLFSGTGSISYELVSRGCKQVTAVEINFQHCKFISEVKSILKISNLQIIRDDSFHFIQKSKQQYDLIFADPPFDMKNFTELPGKVLSANILQPDGLLIVEHNKYHSFDNLPEFFELRKYGSVNFSFFRSLPTEDLLKNRE
jgi:16S rRNA (guanine966-N2)-methyltransferase